MVFELTKYAARDDNLLDQSFVHMMRMIAKIAVIVVGVIYLLRAVCGKPLSALLAGLGIGGLAVALAAQDTLKNVFGGLLLAMEFNVDIAQDVLMTCLEKGLLINRLKPNAVRFIPPLIISTHEVDAALDILDNALSSVVDSTD